MTAHPTDDPSAPVVVAVVQARMGSTRLPGKVVADIEGQPLLAWTVRSVQAIRGVSRVVVATTTATQDDVTAALAAELGVSVHRGPDRDVLTRCHDAVTAFGPDVVVRQTGDNPFPDPTVAATQVRALVEHQYDYVGVDGWPLGIAAEACRMAALDAAAREATDAADREHVMPFLYRQPDRFRIGRSPRTSRGPAASAGARYTVDTQADLSFARALAARLGHGPPVGIEELEAIVANEPQLLELNSAVAQRSWRDAESPREDRWTS